MPDLSPDGASVVVPAYNEQDRVAATVSAAAAIPGVDLVVVVDDGSSDGTAAAAGGAGAVVLRRAANRGKASAIELGAAEVAARESTSGVPGRPMLFLDADLEATASAGAVLLDAVRTGSADMAIGVLPVRRRPAGVTASSSGWPEKASARRPAGRRRSRCRGSAASRGRRTTRPSRWRPAGESRWG